MRYLFFLFWPQNVKQNAKHQVLMDYVSQIHFFCVYKEGRHLIFEVCLLEISVYRLEIQIAVYM